MKYTSILLLILISACSTPRQTTTDRVVPKNATTERVDPRDTTAKRVAPEQTIIERVVTPPDLTTYRNLTNLKPEVVMLYETFLQNPPDYDRIWSIRLRLAQAYEYEKGKESGETAGLINNIRKALDGDLEQRGKEGPWNPTQISARIKNIESVFGSAIKKAWSERK